MKRAACSSLVDFPGLPHSTVREGQNGENAVTLAGQAIRGVALGVGVTAVVQSGLGGIGLAIAGVPFAGLLTAVMLMLCIAQIGTFLVMFAIINVAYFAYGGWFWAIKASGLSWTLLRNTWYQENMFAVKSAHAFTHPEDPDADQRIFALKPMNCPGHVQIFKHGLKSYRDLPIRLAEFGNVHRYEASGALHGLMRVRAFTQDDAHIFCTEDQLEAEILKINDLMMSVYKDFGFEEVVVKLATRPEKRVGTDAMWDHAEEILKRSLERMAREDNRIKTGINEGEGTFYGPKFEYTLRDAIGREWQCGTTQVDFNLPERFGAFYIGADSEKKQPVMVHRAICGSLERFLGILLENYSGHVPLWFAPVQVVVATITSDADEYATAVVKKLKAAGLSAEVDLRNEKINYKVREHSLAKVPVLLVCGRREAEEATVNIRRLGSRDQESMSLDAAVAALVDEATPPDVKRRAAAA